MRAIRSSTGRRRFLRRQQGLRRRAREGAESATPPQDIKTDHSQIWTYEQGFELHRPGMHGVSVATSFYSFTGGAHGSSGLLATLVDLRTGRSVAPADIFQPTAEWERTLADIARDDLKRQFVERPGFADALEPAKFDKLMKDPQRYLFKAFALELIFNQYEVAPYASGMYRVNSSSDSGSYSVARWRADETWLWTRNRSAPCSAQNGPNRRAAPGRRRDRGLRARGVDLVEPAGDEVLADRLPVRLGEERLDVAVGGRRDPLEDVVRIVVAGLDALEVEDRQPAETRQRTGHPRSTTASIAEARIGIARSMPQNVWARSTSAGSMVSVPGASETSSKP